MKAGLGERPDLRSRLGILCGFQGAIAMILDSSMVEHSAVNRGVVGSSPTRGVFYYMAPWSSG